MSQLSGVPKFGNKGTLASWGEENLLWPTMVGRVYVWRGELWRVCVRWRDNGPRNVLIENIATGERTVRPFRGLRRP